MTDRNEVEQSVAQSVDTLVRSIHAEPRLHHMNRVHLPSRERVVAAIELLRQLMYPGYFGKQGLTSENLSYHVGEVVVELREMLYEQVRCCLRYRENLTADQRSGKCDECDAEAEQIVTEFFSRLPRVRELLAADVQAAFDGDPAAQSTDETIFSYPGLLAITVQRLAHEFFTQNVPLLPRMMTEWVHGLTGIDIHPGATLGKGLMIDHGTGVVIGETTIIGNNVKIYQGVTLGALAPAFGQLLRGQKRHPTIEDNVTIYAGATILGGETTIGKGSTIGGNLFLTASVPPMHVVTAEPPKINMRDRRPKRDRGGEYAI
jgi:serine O-acetyltransferase